VASVDEKVFSFLASCQILHNLNIPTIDFSNVLYNIQYIREINCRNI